MQKRWLLLIPFAVAGTFLILIHSVLAIMFPAFIFVAALMMVASQFGVMGRQKLLITVPVPRDTPLKTVPLLLDAKDGQVYRYVMGHGGKKARGNACEMRIKYSGVIIYNQTTNTFTIGGQKHVPNALRIRELD
jgi:hypothetical protein